MSHSEIVFRITVRGWDPKKKEGIVGEAALARTAPVPNIPPIPGMNPVSIVSRQSPVPMPYPFASIYLPVEELAIAVSGTPTPDFGLALEGQNLRAALKNYVSKKKNGGVSFKIMRDGLISSRVQIFVGEDGRRRTFVPLEDVAKAFGGNLEFNQATWTFSIKTGNYPNCLLEYLPPDAAEK